MVSRSVLNLILVISLLLPWLTGTARPVQAAPALQAVPPGTVTLPGPDRVEAAYSRLPLAFVPNRGQSDESILYEVITGGAALRFGLTGVTLVQPGGGEDSLPAPGAPQPLVPAPLSPPPLHLRFAGANPAPTLQAGGRLPGVFHYYKGSDPAGWQTNVPSYGRLTYAALWPGIDLAYEGRAGVLKSTFTVAPGADPDSIRLAYPAGTRLSVDGEGGLVIRAGELSLRESPPVAWQEIPGRGRAPVPAAYRLLDGATYTFDLPEGYNPAYPLVIDPELVYSTYLGLPGDGRAQNIGVDGAGNMYVLANVGPTSNPNFHISIWKFNAAGTAPLYVTFLSGSNFDIGYSLAVDSQGYAYAAGYTTSANFPTTPGALATSLSGPGDGFVARLTPDGNLGYATFLGGSDYESSTGLALDEAGNAYVTGSTSSADFPVTSGAYDSGCGTDGLCNPNSWNRRSDDTYVAKLNSSGSGLIYATFLGGSSSDYGLSIAVDPAGNSYVAGMTRSVDFPVTPGVLDPTCGTDGACNLSQSSDHHDTFVARLNANGTGLVYATYLGGSRQEEGLALTVDPTGYAYLAGSTDSPDFPTSPAALAPHLVGDTCGVAPDTYPCQDAFVVKITPAGGLAYATYLGTTGQDIAYDILIDEAGQAIVAGETEGPGFPVTAGALDPDYAAGSCTYMGSGPVPCFDGFLTQLNAAGSGVVYSTYWGGSLNDVVLGLARDNAGLLYLAGSTMSADFPTTGAWRPGYTGGTCGTSPNTYPCPDGFITKLSLPLPSPRYVAPGGVDAGNECQDSGQPCATVQHAVDVAISGDTIKVAAGVYTDMHQHAAPPGYNPPLTLTQVVYLDKSLTVRGGYTPAFGEPANPAANPTSLNAQDQGRVFFITGNTSPVVEGLQITGGSATGQGGHRLAGVDAGGGVYGLTATVTLSGNIISNNQANISPAGAGGGVYLAYSRASLISNTIQSNDARQVGPAGTAELGGAGVYLFASSGTVLNRNVFSANEADTGEGGGGAVAIHASQNVSLANNVIRDNKTMSKGGGLYADNSTGLALSDNLITGNSAYLGGGLHLRRSSAALTNTVIAGNFGQAGPLAEPGVVIDSSMAQFWHSTITGNRTGTGSGLVIANNFGSMPQVVLTNTILANQAVAIKAIAGTVTLESTLWHGNTVNWSGAGSVSTGSHNYTGDPAFVNAEMDDYHLTWTSAAIDRGSAAGVIHDIDGQPRPQGSGPDLGAVEYPLVGTPALAIGKSAPLLAAAGASITYTLTVTNSGSAPAYDLLVTDTIPAGAGYLGGGSRTGPIVSWPIPYLAAQGGVTQATFSVTATGTITNNDYRVSARGGYSASGGPPLVTVVEGTIAGLTVTNDSPTVLGRPTTLTATLTAGEGVTYTWSLGNGTAAFTAVVSHTYPVTGVYTAMVTASNRVSVLTATTRVTIKARESYLPQILRMQ